MKDTSELTSIPNVGKATAGDLERIGIASLNDLKGADAVQLFEKLCTIDGKQHDPCTLDIFLSAIDYVTNGESKPWWEYSELRKTLYKLS